MPIETGAGTIRLGHVESHGGRLEMSLDIRPDGTAALVIAAGELSGHRNCGVVILGYYGATELRQLFDHAEATVQRLAATGQIVGLMRDR